MYGHVGDSGACFIRHIHIHFEPDPFLCEEPIHKSRSASYARDRRHGT